MKLLLFLLTVLCVTATAAPLPPLPVVRPKPLLSPAHSAAPKSKTMVKATTLVVFDPYLPPKVPMTMEVAVVSNLFGKYLFTASALQPPNHALSLQMSAILGEWVEVGYFGPQPEAQTSFVSLYANAETMYVRARLIPIPPVSGQTQTGWMPASLVPVVGIAGRVYVNPSLPGARAWSVRK